MSDREFKAAIIRSADGIRGGMAPGNMLRLIRLVNKHIPLPFGSARNSRDFINVKNLVEFIHLAVEKEVEGVFYPTDKVPYSTRNVVEEISLSIGSTHGKFTFSFYILETGREGSVLIFIRNFGEMWLLIVS